MNQVTIHIPDMQSTHCQARVSNAVNAIKGVQIQHVEAGVITVSFDHTKDEIVNAIEKAGYTVAQLDKQ